MAFLIASVRSTDDAAVDDDDEEMFVGCLNIWLVHKLSAPFIMMAFAKRFATRSSLRCQIAWHEFKWWLSELVECASNVPRS